jgi:type III pantothenate kinase
MYLVIDVGNSRVKSAVFENDKLIERIIFIHEDFQNSITNLLKKYPHINVLIASSVGKLEKKSFDAFENHLKVVFITKDYKFPIQNQYTTPETLGIDRLILAAGAVLQFPNKNRLVIDAGTCVTYDYIDEENNYLGGGISPGISLRYKSLHNYTSKLPLLSKSEPENIIGNSTNQSIHSGVINGLVFEINGLIDAYCINNKNFIIILTGGDAEFLAKRLKNTIFANSNFLLESLKQIYQYNQND